MEARAEASSRDKTCVSMMSGWMVEIEPLPLLVVLVAANDEVAISCI